MRKCSKPGCGRGAVATLTYDYHDSTAVLGPLATSAQPHAYDLCEDHAESMTVPRGWQVMRLQTKFEPAPPSGDDLLALVEVIRDVAGGHGEEEAPADQSARFGGSHVRGRHPTTFGAPDLGPPPSAATQTEGLHKQRGRFEVIHGDQSPQEADLPNGGSGAWEEGDF